MVDTPSPVLLQRLQEIGTNLNLWGTYLNVDLEILEQASKGYQTLAVTGDATISWTNYARGNTGACALLKLTGSLGSPAALTFPGRNNFLLVWNTAGAAVTIKCSAGTGVTIGNGDKALIFCNSVDYFNAAPNTFNGILHGVTAGTAPTDAVNKDQMETAIATAGLPATAGTFLISSLDTTPGYAAQKILATGDATVTDSGAGNATLTINVNAKRTALGMAMILGG